MALPALSADLGLTLLSSSWIISLFSVLVGLFGMLIGFSAGRINYRNAAFLGLLVASLASVVGAQAESQKLLLLSRSFEGLGWILAAVSIPVLMVAVSTARDRPYVLGLWGAFLPAGAAVAMLLAPLLLEQGGWRGLWRYSAMGSALGAVLVYFAAAGINTPRVEVFSLRLAGDVVLRKTSLYVFGCFLVYSAQFLAVTSFMPVMLIEQADMALANAALLSAIVVLSNVIGNVLSGVLLARGVSRFGILRFALVNMLVLAVFIFLEQASLVVRIPAALGFIALAGLIPGTLFATAPLLVRDMAHAGIINGLLLQAAGTGQLLGPIMLAALVEWRQNWAAAIVFTTAACTLGLLCVRALRESGIER